MVLEFGATKLVKDEDGRVDACAAVGLRLSPKLLIEEIPDQASMVTDLIKVITLAFESFVTSDAWEDTRLVAVSAGGGRRLVGDLGAQGRLLETAA